MGAEMAEHFLNVYPWGFGDAVWPTFEEANEIAAPVGGVTLAAQRVERHADGTVSLLNARVAAPREVV